MLIERLDMAFNHPCWSFLKGSSVQQLAAEKTPLTKTFIQLWTPHALAQGLAHWTVPINSFQPRYQNLGKPAQSYSFIVHLRSHLDPAMPKRLLSNPSTSSTPSCTETAPTNRKRSRTNITVNYEPKSEKEELKLKAEPFDLQLREADEQGTSSTMVSLFKSRHSSVLSSDSHLCLISTTFAILNVEYVHDVETGWVNSFKHQYHIFT